VAWTISLVEIGADDEEQWVDVMLRWSPEFGQRFKPNFPLCHWDRPEIWGIITTMIGSVGYVAGWGSTDGMDAVFGWGGD
jgi:hypothetical protein